MGVVEEVVLLDVFRDNVVAQTTLFCTFVSYYDSRWVPYTIWRQTDDDAGLFAYGDGNCCIFLQGSHRHYA